MSKDPPGMSDAHSHEPQDGYRPIAEYALIDNCRTAVDIAHGQKHGPEEQSVTEGERAPRARHAASEGYG